MRYISIRQLLSDITEHPLLKDVSFERVVNYIVHFIRIVGMPKEFKETVENIEIKEYRGILPCDLESIIQVRTVPKCGDKYKVLRYSTDSFHMSDKKQDSYDLTYKVQGNVIYTSMKEGTIEIAYRAIPVDSDGYPMIPDNSAFIRAAELYVKKQVFTILFDLGKITPQVYNNTCQDYSFAVGQAQSELIKPSIDEMESLKNSWCTLIPRTTQHKSGFVNNGVQEKIKNQ